MPTPDIGTDNGNDSDPIDSSTDEDDEFNVISLITGNKNNSITRNDNHNGSRQNSFDSSQLNKKQKISPASFFSFTAKTTPETYTKQVSPARITRSESPYRTTRSITRANRRAVDDDDDEDEFSVQLPSIFETEGRRNEVISENDRLIKQDFINEESRLKKNYQRLIVKKNQILQELNYNGSNGLKFYTLSKDEHLIEKILKNNFKQSNSRHFYFLNNCHTILLNSNHTELIWSDLPFKINDFFFYNLTSPSLDVTRYAKYIKSIVNYSLISVSDGDKLRQLNQLCHDLIDVPVSLTSSISIEEFTKYITLVGCDGKLLQIDMDQSHTVKSALPIKLNQFNNNLEITIVRITIIFNLTLLHINSGSEIQLIQYMIKIFNLILSDFNLNKRQYPSLIQFIRSILPQLYYKYIAISEQNHFTLLKFFNQTLYHDLVTNVFNQEPTADKRYDYELQFNVIKLLYNSVSISDDLQLHKFVTNLSLSFLLDEDYDNFQQKDKPHQRQVDLTPNIEVLETIFNKLLSINMVQGLKNNDITKINLVYHIHYKILLLNHVMVRAYVNEPNVEVNSTTKLSEKQFEMIRSCNVSRLKRLLGLIEKLKSKMYDNIRQIGFISNNNAHSTAITNSRDQENDADNGNHHNDDSDIDTDYNNAINTEELVKYVTDSFHILNYLYNKFENDLYPINDDIFYNST